MTRRPAAFYAEEYAAACEQRAAAYDVLACRPEPEGSVHARTARFWRKLAAEALADAIEFRKLSSAD